MDHISDNTISFLLALAKNNNREWFQRHKEKYVASHAEMISFAESLMEAMRSHDQIVEMTGKKSLFRIYRDVRFAKDKSPYKTHWAGRIKRDTPYLRGGYFYRVEADKAYIACGFWAPNPKDLKLIRSHIAADDAPLREVLKDKNFIKTFGSLEGDQVKTSPKGYSKDHPSIDLLRYKQLIVSKVYKPNEMKKRGFTQQMSNDFKQIRPFFNYMSEILTHNLNGESLIE